MLHSELHTKLHSPTTYDHIIVDHIIEHFNINSNKLEGIEFDTICEMAREEYNQHLKEKFIGGTKLTEDEKIYLSSHTPFAPSRIETFSADEFWNEESRLKRWIKRIAKAIRSRKPNDYCSGCGGNWYNPNKGAFKS
jgi:hypothetical protein|tara:strand:+ start:477 stop:887 length:411 start_codon:yes stop_codon:yes gene_type:complete